MNTHASWRIDRDAYDQLLTLPYSGWCWEYKRRDGALKSAARRLSARRPTILRRPDGSTVYRLRTRQPQAEKFGLYYLPDPSLNAFQTTPFWLPESMSTHLNASSETNDQKRVIEPPLRWDEIPGEKHFLISPGRRPKIIIEAPGYAAQLAIEEHALPVPHAVYLSLRLGAGLLQGRNLSSVEEFARHCLGRDVTCKTLRGYSPETLRNTIIALDGHLAGVTQRQIAEVIFGVDAVSRDWNSGVKSYKSRTRRLIKKGVELMKFGNKYLL